MKQVYIINEESRASVYGIGTYIRQLIECLQDKKDIRINLVLLHAQEKEFRQIKKEKYTLYYIPYVDAPNYEEKFYRNVGFLLAATIRRDRDDDLIFHFNYTWEYPLMHFFKEYFPQCKIFFTIHYQKWCFSLCGDVDLFKKVVNREKNCLKEEDAKIVRENFEEEKKLYQYVDKIICLSRFTKEIVKDVYRIPNKKIHLIYNGIDNVWLESSPADKYALRQNYFFNKTDKLLLFVGRLDEIKGLSTVIEAFKEVLEVCPDSHLLIVGEGHFKEYLKMGAPFWSKITFTGFLDQEDLYEIYQMADVGIMLSLHEQCSYVAIEMMMFGLPVISTDTTGLDEMFPGNLLKVQVGYQEGKALLPVQECKNKIIQALKCPQTIGSDNKQRYLERYTLNRLTEALVGLYGED